MRSPQCTRLSAPKWMLTRLWLQCRQRRIRIFAALNLDLPDWYGLFDKKPLVDALIDRLQHHCITIRIDGPSLRSPDPAAPPPVSPKRRTTPA